LSNNKLNVFSNLGKSKKVVAGVVADQLKDSSPIRSIEVHELEALVDDALKGKIEQEFSKVEQEYEKPVDRLEAKRKVSQFLSTNKYEIIDHDKMDFFSKLEEKAKYELNKHRELEDML
jgi:hypothetical protein